MRKAVGLTLFAGLAVLFPRTALAAGETLPTWPAWNLLAAFLGWLVPLGLILLAAGATAPSEAGEAVGTALACLAAGLVAYVVCGFAFQFGGLGLQCGWPGLEGLTAEWSPLDPGLGWGLLGLRGFFLGGAAATPDAYALAAAQLPATAVAVLLPTLALARRAPRGALLGIAAMTGGILYPLAGNWVWGGGWLALLGLNAGWGHGFVDVGGSATIHLLGAGVALAGILIIGRGQPTGQSPEVVELPPVHFPLLTLVGPVLALAGWLGLVLANPLVTPDLAPGLVALDLALGALGGMAPALLYGWLATGRLDAQLAARGLMAGLAAAGAAAGLMPPAAALLVGLVAGVALPLLLYGVEHRLGWHDPNAILATHGAPGLLGALWLALFASGRWGVGWNGVPSRFGLVQQGVAGLIVARGYASDVAQLWAQAGGVGGIVLLAFAAPAALFGLARGGQALLRRLAPGRRHAYVPGRRW